MRLTPFVRNRLIFVVIVSALAATPWLAVQSWVWAASVAASSLAFWTCVATAYWLATTTSPAKQQVRLGFMLFLLVLAAVIAWFGQRTTQIGLQTYLLAIVVAAAAMQAWALAPAEWKARLGSALRPPHPPAA